MKPGPLHTSSSRSPAKQYPSFPQHIIYREAAMDQGWVHGPDLCDAAESSGQYAD